MTELPASGYEPLIEQPGPFTILSRVRSPLCRLCPTVS